LHYPRVAKMLLQPYWRLTRGLTLGVRGAVFDNKDGVLLVRHTYTRGWHFPGGGVEFNETIYAALERELLEEAGIALAGPAPELFGLYCNSETFPGDHVALFVVRTWERRRAFTANREIAQAEFFAPHAMPDEVSAGTQRRIDEINGLQPRQATW
jgi:8-oxo-dGTP pyrophosphatase MutT (NUDIX family)